MEAARMEKARALFVQAAPLLLKQDYAGAEPLLRSALALAPGRPSIIVNLTAALIGQKKYAEAKPLAAQATATDPDNAEAWLNLGRCLELEKDYPAALQAYRRALTIRPDYAEAWSNCGNVLMLLRQTDEALATYERATALKPDFAEALGNQAILLNQLNRQAEAIAKIERAMALKPDLPQARSIRLQARMAVCDWSGFAEDHSVITSQIAEGRLAAPPFAFLCQPSTPALQRRCAELYVAGTFPATPPVDFPPPVSGRRLRVGYFSADFHRHATAFLMAGLFEQHDRSRFEIFGISFGKSYQDDMRRRLIAGMEHFIDVYGKSDAEIVALVRGMELDIAIDLKGYTLNARAGIFASRVAPLQASYLGYPGTMGAGFIDYIIADGVVIPPAHDAHYTEAVVRLPHSYQVTDSRREIAARDFSRADCGLPQDGFVFCCFNNTYKITPDIFDIWMRLLQAVPGSVLWLLEASAGVADRLKAEAQTRGVAPERLVFAPRMDQAEHLARQRLANLFLDTFHYNAHTTASDALWAGLPVLTRLGDSFAGRVAASLLQAAGLPELITTSSADYEKLALALATDPARLMALRQKLAATRDTCPLFDTPRFARGIEVAFEAMQAKRQRGLPPGAIAVDAL
ncbi:MAG: tetratricopeptide repeat protein [Alphaproteobacteria bacterium]|nr:tetratricopeptide repeat protein [Alphaproteobacteria bacterium]